jgi:hypothetical protein
MMIDLLLTDGVWDSLLWLWFFTCESHRLLEEDLLLDWTELFIDF